MMGNTPVSIYNNRRGVTEWLYTNQQEQLAVAGMKYMMDSGGLSFPLGAFGTMLVVTTVIWRNSKYNFSKEIREKMEQIKQQISY